MHKNQSNQIVLMVKGWRDYNKVLSLILMYKYVKKAGIWQWLWVINCVSKTLSFLMNY